MKVGEAIEIITHYVSKSESLVFEDFLEIAKIYFEKLGFVCVPFTLTEENEKVKKKPLGNWGELRKEGITWEEIEEYWRKAVARKRVKKVSTKEGEKVETYLSEDIKKKSFVSGIGALTGKVSAITVIDVDDIERFERSFEVKLDELVSTTLAQGTPRGGIHLFYKYDPELKTGTFKEYGLDIRNDDALIVLYPSFVLNAPEKKYSFINEKVSEIESVPEKLRKLLTKKRSVREKEVEHEGKKSVHFLVFKRTRKEELEKVAKLLSELYREEKVSGHEDIDFAFVGGLVEIGVDERDIHELLEIIYGDEYDEALSQYVIERAKERIEKGEKYISLGTLVYKLKQLSDERAKEILEVLSPKTTPVAPDFFEKGGVLFKLTKGNFIPVAPYITLKEKLEGKNETFYVAEYRGKEFFLPMGKRERIVEVIENETGISVANLQALKEFLIYEQTTKEIPVKKLVTRVGWDEGVFRIPTIEREDEVWDIPYLDRFTVGEKEEDHFRVVNEVLLSGSDLSILVLSALSSPLLHIIDTQPFLVHVSGRPASGKTTACSFAVSCFYKGKDYFTLHSTQNAIEILLSTFRDIPILFDEEELSRDPQFLITLAYMLFSSKGKSRATKSLKVHQSEIRNVVFTTSEHSIEDTLAYLEGKGVVSKLGALRRVLHVEVEEDFWKGVDFKEVEKSLREVWGHFGKAFVLWLEENVERIREIYEREKKRETVSGSEHIFTALWTTKYLLEEFTGLKFSQLEDVIRKYEQKQREKLSKKMDVVEKFKNSFPPFVVSNLHRFFHAKNRHPKEAIGAVHENGDVFIFERGLKEFFQTEGLPFNETVRRLESEGIIKKMLKKFEFVEMEVQGYFVFGNKLQEEESFKEQTPEVLDGMEERKEEEDVDISEIDF